MSLNGSKEGQRSSQFLFVRRLKSRGRVRCRSRALYRNSACRSFSRLLHGVRGRGFLGRHCHDRRYACCLPGLGPEIPSVRRVPELPKPEGGYQRILALGDSWLNGKIVLEEQWELYPLVKWRDLTTTPTFDSSSDASSWTVQCS